MKVISNRGFRDSRCHIWLRHFATSLKVAGSIRGVIGIFNSNNHSGRTAAMVATQLLTEMSISNVSWGLKAAGV
jgi:hypothetical protein